MIRISKYSLASGRGSMATHFCALSCFDCAAKNSWILMGNTVSLLEFCRGWAILTGHGVFSASHQREVIWSEVEVLADLSTK